ncbi:bifunctional adenosylcobinamide kinase/adenosylcobinamide-phosphate guanylyltransferase [Lachnospiraceae bacterium ZAX-1]
MTVLVIGASGSGKSEYAEQYAVQLGQYENDQANTTKPNRNLIYIATMEPYDAESDERIKRHRNLRKGKCFHTLECHTHLEEVKLGEADTVLLECISNLTANEMYGLSGRKKQVAKTIVMGIKQLAEMAKHVVIVTNNVFEDGMDYDEATTRYLKNMAEINEQAARLADHVIEVVHGIPIQLK